MNTDPRLAHLRRVITHDIPHHRALGLRVDALTLDRVHLTLPHAPRLIGHPGTGALHSSVITTLLDAACSAAVFAKLSHLLATLDLRVDHLRPSQPGRDLFAVASCHHITPRVAYARAVAHHGDPDAAVAAAHATFTVFDDQRVAFSMDAP